MTYNDVMTEMIGEDRDEAMRYMDDDIQFDAWLSRYAAKQKSRNTNKRGTPISKEEFFQRTQGKLPQPGKRNAKNKGKGKG